MTTTPYRIVFFGTSDFSVPILEALHASDHFEILEAVSQPDRPAGRHRALMAPPVKRLSETRGITVYQPEKLRSDEVLAHFRELKADAFVVVSYGMILPQTLLDIPSRGAINIHGSLLPKHRGASPVAGAIMSGDAVTGVTIMRMDAKMDEGPTLAFSEDIVIEPIHTRASLMEKLQNVAADMIGPTLLEYLDGRIDAKEQDHENATTTKILKRDDGLIDWHATAEEIDRQVRGLDPWPGTHTILTHNKKTLRLAIKKVEIANAMSPCASESQPGLVGRASDGGMLVECGTGCLLVTLLQLEGKKEATGPSFLNGYPDVTGQTLG